jgi:uncharacterized phage protein (TIGR01671 family)
MREILFRGKLKDTGEWVYWDVFGRITTHTGKQYILTVTSGAHTAYYYHAYQIMEKIDRTSIGQSTSLKDKNRKRIFEGDIIHLDYIGKTRGVEGIATVIFENGKFGVKWGWHKEFVCLDGFANTTLEIVGNIHDNTQLSERGVENAPDVR